jgi:hypothetical protein
VHAVSIRDAVNGGVEGERKGEDVGEDPDTARIGKLAHRSLIIGQSETVRTGL